MGLKPAHTAAAKHACTSTMLPPTLISFSTDLLFLTCTACQEPHVLQVLVSLTFVCPLAAPAPEIPGSGGAAALLQIKTSLDFGAVASSADWVGWRAGVPEPCGPGAVQWTFVNCSDDGTVDGLNITDVPEVQGKPFPVTVPLSMEGVFSPVPASF